MAKSKKTDSEKLKKGDKEKKGKKKEKAVAEPVAPAPAKAPAKKTAVKKTAAPKPLKEVAPQIMITTEEISLRAYFIAERRQAMGWPGDSTTDWVEAERQLRTEAARKARG